MLKDFYSMLPELYGTNSCTFNAHSLTHLTMYVRLWGPLWTHSLFGFESFNGHLSSMIHSKYRVAEQVSFSIDVFQTIGNLADKLVQTETDRTIRFIEPMSSSIPRHRHMMLILSGIYSIGKVHSSTFSQEEQNANQVVTNIPTNEILIFHKLYQQYFIQVKSIMANEIAQSVATFPVERKKNMVLKGFQRQRQRACTSIQ